MGFVCDFCLRDTRRQYLSKGFTCSICDCVEGFVLQFGLQAGVVRWRDICRAVLSDVSVLDVCIHTHW